MSPSDVTAMLAKSHVLDTRCNILADADRQDLMDFLARAEILLAERESVKAAQAAIRKGRAEAQAAACGPDQATTVRGVLAAARASTAETAAAAPQPAPVQAAAPAPEPAAVAAATLKPAILPDEQPATKKKPKPAKAAEQKKPAKPAVKAEAPKPAETKKAKAGSSLERYASLAKRYYVELKCRNMSDAAVQRLYSNVLATHRKAVAESGAPAVRSVLRSAEARASQAGCG